MMDLIITSLELVILGSNKIYSSNKGRPGFISLHLNMKMLEGDEVRHFYKSNIQEGRGLQLLTVLLAVRVGTGQAWKGPILGRILMLLTPVFL